MENLAKRTALGAAWMMFSKLAIRFIGLISTLILVRLLSPEDFGIAAMAMTVVAFVELLTTFGFDVAIIQNQEADADDYNTAWSLNIFLGIGAAALLVALAFPAASFYGRPELVPVYMVLALATLFQGLENIGIVDFRKDLNFDKEFLFRVAVKLIAFFITIGIAWWMRSYWALIIGTVVSRFAATCLSYWAHPFRPRLSLAGLSKIMNFSRWLFLNNMVNMFRKIGPELIIGRVSGARSLGVFTVAFEISNLPTTELVAPANRALLPGFSRISNDLERAGRQFVRVTGLLSLLSMPTGLGIAVTASLFTPLVLGDQWVSAIPVIQVLAIFGSIMAIQSPITMILVALGKPKWVSLMSLAQLLFMLPLMTYLNIRDGVVGAAIALLITSTLSLPVYFGLAAKSMQVRKRQLTLAVCRPLLAALLMYVCVDALLPTLSVSFGGLLIAALSGVAVFVSCMGLLWWISGRPNNVAEYEVASVGLGYGRKLVGKLRHG